MRCARGCFVNILQQVLILYNDSFRNLLWNATFSIMPMASLTLERRDSQSAKAYHQHSSVVEHASELKMEPLKSQKRS
jgi:hypothetical protein